jgi:pimeloyl-ACP methyl ester carboxylesterase
MSSLAPVWIEAGHHAAKTTLVFLHGIGGGKKGFQSSVDFFAKQGFRALAWDMPGYGDSPLDGTLSFESLAASLEDMLDAAKVEKAVLVGHSMGGMVALQAFTAAHRALQVWSLLQAAQRLVNKTAIFKNNLSLKGWRLWTLAKPWRMLPIV